MSETQEILIFCDLAALHPKHPRSLVMSFSPSPVGSGWIANLSSRGHGTGPVGGDVNRFMAALKRNGNVVTLKGDERPPHFGPLMTDALLGRATPSESEVRAERDELSQGTRRVHRLECRLCHKNPVDVREENLWRILNLMRLAGEDSVTLRELHDRLQPSAQVVD